MMELLFAVKAIVSRATVPRVRLCVTHVPLAVCLAVVSVHTIERCMHSAGEGEEGRAERVRLRALQLSADA